jgi:dihydrolipoamide dehydrogenase
MDYEVLVIGAGPGGYHAAIRAAQMGKKTACVEAEYLGGVCLNVGCIPTKALLHVADELRSAQHAGDFGVTFAKPDINLEAMNKWKDGVVKKLTGGVGVLLKGNGVEVFDGTATFKDAHTVQIGDKSVSAEKIIVATGSEPIEIPGFETNGDTIVNSTGALLLSEVPKRFLTIGGGAIGLEFADIYHALGAEVTVVELLDQIVPTSDADAANELAKSFKKRGITIKTKTKAVKCEETADGLEVTLENTAGEQETLTVDKILVAVGRKPRGAGLGLEELGVTVERGYLPVNEHMQTDVPHIYAIGDVARAPLLAHKAMKEGLVAAEHAAGKPAAYDTIVPNVVYTSPELASVGMTEKEAREAGREVRVGIFPLQASGRAMTLGVNEGLVKVIGDAQSDLLLGFHMVGPSAGDMVSEAALAIEMGATLEDISLTQHAHPTLGESFMEAAEAAHGLSIHLPKPRKRKD